MRLIYLNRSTTLTASLNQTDRVVCNDGYRIKGANQTHTSDIVCNNGESINKTV